MNRALERQFHDIARQVQEKPALLQHNIFDYFTFLLNYMCTSTYKNRELEYVGEPVTQYNIYNNKIKYNIQVNRCVDIERKTR